VQGWEHFLALAPKRLWYQQVVVAAPSRMRSVTRAAVSGARAAFADATARISGMGMMIPGTEVVRLELRFSTLRESSRG
jgi:hypothetical protein